MYRTIQVSLRNKVMVLFERIGLLPVPLALKFQVPRRSLLSISKGLGLNIWPEPLVAAAAHPLTCFRRYTSSQSRVLLPVVTLFTKDDCSLCDIAKENLMKFKSKFVYKEVDISLTENQEWFEKYKYDIPVLHINGKLLMKHKVFENILLEALENANPRSRTNSDVRHKCQEDSSSSFNTKQTAKIQRDIITADEVVNFFSGNALDRCSHLRKDSKFFHSVVADSSSRFVIFENLNPLSCKSSETKRSSLKTLSGEEMSELLGRKSAHLEDIVFLGQDTEQQHSEDLRHPRRRSWFAVDLKDEGKCERLIEKLTNDNNAQVFSFASPLSTMLSYPSKDASIAGQARAILAWHQSHLYCPCCGMKTTMAEGGYKRACSNDSCDSNKVVHHVSYPRVDPVAMTLIESPSRSSILLGRKRSFPRGLYSCLAGFVEPAESIEDAARREIFEESGVYVENIRYHSSQPWPFPSTLSIGFMATALNMELVVDEEELEDVRWFPKDDIKYMITPEAIKNGMRRTGSFFAPPRQTLANQLMRAWIQL